MPSIVIYLKVKYLIQYGVIRFLLGVVRSVSVTPSKYLVSKYLLLSPELGLCVRQALLERKKGANADKGKGKFTAEEVQAMQDVD